jgi:hypothetical protein
MLITAVDILWSDKFLDSVEVPLLGGVQQGIVTTQQVSNITIVTLHHVQWGQVVTVTTVNISSML